MLHSSACVPSLQQQRRRGKHADHLGSVRSGKEIETSKFEVTPSPRSENRLLCHSDCDYAWNNCRWNGQLVQVSVEGAGKRGLTRVSESEA